MQFWPICMLKKTRTEFPAWYVWTSVLDLAKKPYETIAYHFFTEFGFAVHILCPKYLGISWAR